MVYTKTINDSMIINFDYVYRYLLSRINVLMSLWTIKGKYDSWEISLLLKQLNINRDVSLKIF